MISLRRPVGPVLLMLLRSLVPAVLLLCGAAAAVWWAQAIAAFAGRREPADGLDFMVFYSAARLVATGHGFQIYDPSALTPIEHAIHPELGPQALPLPYFNPPFFALLLAPLAYISFDHAYRVWTALKVVFLVVNGWMVWRISEPLERRWRILAVAGYVTLEPVVYAFVLGQFSQIVIAGWTGAYLLLRRGRETTAGFALSLLLIKPDLLIAAGVVLLWTRRLRTLAALASVSIAMVLLSVGVVGVRGLVEYPHFLLSTASEGSTGVTTSWMFGWNALVAELPGPPSHAVALAVGAMLSLGTLATLLLCWRRSDGTDADDAAFPMQWMMLTLATVLMSPHFYIQDIAIVMPAGLAVVCAFDGRERLIGGAALGVAWAVLGLGFIPPRDWHVNIFSIAMAFGFVAVAAQLLAGRRAAVAGDEFERGMARAA